MKTFGNIKKSRAKSIVDMKDLTSSLKSQMILGILGSGQLARMSAIAASELGITVHIYCPESEISPAQHVASETFKGPFSDKEAILKFCSRCDFVTLENEFIDQEILQAIDVNFPNRLFPTSKTFSLIGDKISEKINFQKIGIKVAPFATVKSASDIKAFAQTHNYPVVLKSSKGGYDGYGNITIKSEAEVEEKFKLLKGDLLVEAFIPYEKELAIILARNQSGEVSVYPIAHTIQENHICHFVSIPADISASLEQKIIQDATKALLSIDAVGIFAFEFFLTKDGELYLNESAPRPHNSGHYTIEGVQTSQFHNHVRSVLNLPLGPTQIRAPHVMMLNLLGTKNAPANLENASDFLKITNGHLHLYGKKLSKVGRKMGHFTLLGNNLLEIKNILEQLKLDYRL